MSKLLVVEDIYSVRLKTELALRKEGDYKVFSANNGSAALKLAAIVQPDIIIMDIVMPDMDGITALQELRIRGINCPVIAYTARREREAGEFLSYGFSAFAPKAANLHNLAATVRRLLQSSVPILKQYAIGAR
jgi:CheY-like chemotaxis protein